MENKEINEKTSTLERLEQYKLLREYINDKFEYSRYADELEFLDIEKALDDLDNFKAKRLKEVIQLRYGIVDGKRHTYKEISEKFDVTPQRVKQIEDKGMRMLKWKISIELTRIFCQKEITSENKDKIQQNLCEKFNQHIEYLPSYTRITKDRLEDWRNCFGEDIDRMVSQYNDVNKMKRYRK